MIKKKTQTTERSEEERHFDEIVRLEGALSDLLGELPRLRPLETLGAGSSAAHRMTLHALHQAEERLADAVRLLEIVRDADAVSPC
jgi:hypothetical protein